MKEQAVICEHAKICQAAVRSSFRWRPVVVVPPCEGGIHLRQLHSLAGYSLRMMLLGERLHLHSNPAKQGTVANGTS